MSVDTRPGYEKNTKPRLEDVSVIELNSLDQFEPVYGKSVRYQVIIDDVKFEFFTNFKENSPYMYVWGQGAVDRQKLNPPIFQRWSWADECPYSVLIHSDSTLNLGGINIGWCLGSEEQYYLPYHESIIRATLKAQSLSEDKLLLYGGSAGGFVSLMLGGYIQGATVVVNNPQIDITKYTDRHVTPLLDTCFNGISFTEARTKYPTRFCVWELYREKQYIPKLYYSQNILDYLHFENHFKDFVNHLPNLLVPKSASFVEKVRFNLYTKTAEGGILHTPFSQEESNRTLENARELFMS
jgi:hypothetical protein